MDFADAHHGSDAPCGCCGYHASEATLNEMSAQLLERAALDFAGLEKVRREESNDAPYVPHEVKLTDLLANHAAGIADEIEGPMLEVLSGSHIDVDRIITTGRAVDSEWQARAWPKTVEAKFGVLASGAALVGGHNVSFGAPLLSDLDRLRIVNGMIRSAKYSTNNYFNTQVMPALIDAAHAAVLDGAANDAMQLAEIRAMLDRRLRSVPYWNVVANAAASRAYHFGYLKVGVAAGEETVEFWNPNDEKTSAICRQLYGTQWRASDVAFLADRIADAPDVSAVKEITPWYKASELAGKTPAELLNMGAVIPPLHGRCRSELRFV